MHTHYKGTGKVHSFRGLLGDEKQHKIRIQGPVGAIAWRIVKLNVITAAPAGSATEHVVKIFREEQASVTGTVDFNDDELLGVAVWTNAVGYGFEGEMAIVFDNTLFSRNIYVTQSELTGSASCNYYIELEEVKISKAGMAQLAVAAARRTID